MGGKSAGHIMPLLTLAQQDSAPAVFITTHRELDKRIIQAARGELVESMRPTLTHIPLYLPDIKRKKIWLYPWHTIIWVYAFTHLMSLFFKTRPQKIISTGGLTAVPVFLFAKVMGIPCELFELNAVPGDAVRFLAPLSSKIFYCYKTVLKHLNDKKLYYKSYPVREFNAVTAA